MEEMREDTDCWDLLDRSSRVTPSDVLVNMREILKSTYPETQCVILENIPSRQFSRKGLRCISMSVGAHIIPRSTRNRSLCALLHLPNTDDACNGLVLSKSLEIQFDLKNWCLFPCDNGTTYKVHVFAYENVDPVRNDNGGYSFKKRAGVPMLAPKDAHVCLVTIRREDKEIITTPTEVPWSDLEGIEVSLPKVSRSALLYHAFRCARKHHEERTLLNLLGQDYVVRPHPVSEKDSPERELVSNMTSTILQWLEGTESPDEVTFLTEGKDHPIRTHNPSTVTTHVNQGQSASVITSKFPKEGRCKVCSAKIPAKYELQKKLKHKEISLLS
jgi:hypothetical protein